MSIVQYKTLHTGARWGEGWDNLMRGVWVVLGKKINTSDSLSWLGGAKQGHTLQATPSESNALVPQIIIHCNGLVSKCSVLREPCTILIELLSIN